MKKTLFLDEYIVFPVPICDLAYNTVIGISVFDMSKPIADSLIGSTTVDVFDKKGRLRQGVHDLWVWKREECDLSWESKTPGLFLSDEIEGINSIHQRVLKYAPSNRCQSVDDSALKRVNTQIQELHESNSKSAYI